MMLAASLGETRNRSMKQRRNLVQNDWRARSSQRAAGAASTSHGAPKTDVIYLNELVDEYDYRDVISDHLPVVVFPGQFE